MGSDSLRRRLLTGISFILIGLRVCCADWIALTGAEKASSVAEIYIESNKVRVILEMGASDFQRLRSITSTELGGASGERVADAIRITADDHILIPQMEKSELRKRRARRFKQHNVGGPPETLAANGESIPADVHYVELVYLLKNNPSRLTFTPAVSKQGRSVIEPGVIVFHDQLPVIDYQFLKQAETLLLDWNDPWYSQFENPEMKRHQQAGVMAYLYIEPNEVRQEILVRIADLPAWMDLGLGASEVVEPKQQDALKNKIGRFLINRNPLIIDGQVPRPILDRVDYLSIEPTGIKRVKGVRPLGIKNTLVGIVIAYITDKPPQKVAIEWSLFSDAVNNVPVTAYDLAGQYDSYVTRETPLFEWENFFDDYDFLDGYQNFTVSAVDVGKDQDHLEIPMVSVAAVLLLLASLRWLIVRRRKGQRIVAPAGVIFLLAVTAITTLPYVRYSIAAGTSKIPVDNEKAALILGQLLKNIYRAFDFREEQDVYDKLAVSVSGELLDEIYLQNRQSIATKKGGGARAKVKRVDVLEAAVHTDLETAKGYFINAEWTTSGTVAHWGHVHTRKNLYQASIIIAPSKGRWIITGFEMLEEKRIDPENKEV